MPSGGGRTQRVDRWLWCARFFKTRSLAAQAVRGGKVAVNGARVKPARELSPGDELRVTRGMESYTFRVLATYSRRGPAPEAQAGYEELPESKAERERRATLRALAGDVRPNVGGRPTKHDRRVWERLRGRRPDARR